MGRTEISSLVSCCCLLLSNIGVAYLAVLFSFLFFFGVSFPECMKVVFQYQKKKKSGDIWVTLSINSGLDLCY